MGEKMANRMDIWKGQLDEWICVDLLFHNIHQHVHLQLLSRQDYLLSLLCTAVFIENAFLLITTSSKPTCYCGNPCTTTYNAIANTIEYQKCLTEIPFGNARLRSCGSHNLMQAMCSSICFPRCKEACGISQRPRQ